MPVNAALRDYLLMRRSVTLPFLGEPGPTEAELRDILTIGTRVPDHGKLAPWRLILFHGNARQQAGEVVASIFALRNPDATADAVHAERQRFLPAPLTIGVISKAAPHPKIPETEQLLSAGNVAFNLVHAAFALGYAAHWVTRWFAYDVEAAQALGAGEGERFVAFIHIGTPQMRLEDRERPDLTSVVSRFGA